MHLFNKGPVTPALWPLPPCLLLPHSHSKCGTNPMALLTRWLIRWLKHLKNRVHRFFLLYLSGRYMTGPLLRSPGIFAPIPQAKVLQRYAIAASAAVLAVVMRGLLDPVLGHVAFYATAYIAVAFCAIVCGLGPAVVTGTVGFLGVFYWFVDPRNSLSISRQSELHSITGFFLVSAVLTALGDANRAKQLQLNQSIAALSKEADERQHAEDNLQRAHDLLERRVAQRTAELSKRKSSYAIYLCAL